MPIMLKKAQMANMIRRAPSLEENLEQNPSSAASATCNDSGTAGVSSSSKTSKDLMGGGKQGSGGFPKSPTSPNVSSCVTNTESFSDFHLVSYMNETRSKSFSHTNNRSGISHATVIRCADVKAEEGSPTDVSISISSTIVTPNSLSITTASDSSKAFIASITATKESLVHSNNNHSGHSNTDKGNEENSNFSLKNHSQQQQQKCMNVRNGGERIQLVDSDTENLSDYPVGSVVHSESKINSGNYVVVDANTIACVNNVPTGLTVASHPGSNTSKFVEGDGMKSISGVGGSGDVSGESCDFSDVSKELASTTTTTTITTNQDCVNLAQKLRLFNSARAAKLAKILSVVEEGNDTAMIDGKYEIVTNQV
jgi:hypothetical protein